jgi:predicted transcriptional regulator
MLRTTFGNTSRRKLSRLSISDTFLVKDLDMLINANIISCNYSFNRRRRSEICLMTRVDKKISQVSKTIFLRHIDEMGY